MIFRIDKKKYLFNFFWILLFLFLIVFPKGGIKIHDIPITWGYILLSIFSSLLLLRKSYLTSKQNIFILLSLLPFQIYSLISISINGIENIGFAISFFLGFFIFPLIFFLILSEYIQNIDLNFFLKILKKALFFLASFGIFLFFYKIFFGKLLEIPFLTINYHDKGLIETMKCIDRGNFLKLISTYNNGNLYGICILMFMPLYNHIEDSFFKRSVVKLSLILTLSRTVWAGLIISEFFFDFFIKKNKSYSFIKFVISSSFLITIFIFIGNILDKNISWFLDPTLGNRINEVNSEYHLLANGPFKYIEEMLYNGIFSTFGLVGLVLFILGFFSPIFIYLIKIRETNESTINKTIFWGLVTYLIVSISDSAILYIPILVIYWFLASMLTNRKNLKNYLQFQKIL